MLLFCLYVRWLLLCLLFFLLFGMFVCVCWAKWSDKSMCKNLIIIPRKRVSVWKKKHFLSFGGINWNWKWSIQRRIKMLWPIDSSPREARTNHYFGFCHNIFRCITALTLFFILFRFKIVLFSYCYFWLMLMGLCLCMSNKIFISL